MEYETSPTMRYDGTGDVPADDNHSEKNGGSTESEGSSEGFVKVEEVLEEAEQQGHSPSEDLPSAPAPTPATETKETIPTEMSMMKHLDPRDDEPASNQRLQDYYDQLPTETAPFVAEEESDPANLHSNVYESHPDPILPDVVEAPPASRHDEDFAPLVDIPASSFTGVTDLIGEGDESPEELLKQEEPTLPEPIEPEIPTPEPLDPPKPETEPETVPPVVEEVEKPPEGGASSSFDVSSLLKCDVGGAFAFWHECIVDLLYWKDVKVSAVTFGLTLLILNSLCCCSIVSVFSYLALSLLTVTISFRFYKFVIQTLNGTQQPNPFQSLLDAEVTLSAEQVRKYTDAILSRVNGFIVNTRDLLLVKNTVASLKFGVLLWLLTYIGACFNGLTILIISDVMAFVLPPVYQKYQKPIDNYYGQAAGKACEVMTLVRSKIPGAKPKAE
uniref:Reticulon-like protein n=1 Tax=Phallusia mammillata TaxID=59560 RepID=A0A6F9DQV8_9ASCI|nr:reticulon [Phallusia mammillata]